MSSDANNRQVGGAHYHAAYQHWDFVVDAGLGYFEGQITKYVVRHRKKNGRQDLEKAQHFAQKLAELARGGAVNGPLAPMFRRQEALRRYLGANPDTTASEVAIMRAASEWGAAYEAARIPGMISALIAESYSEQPS